MIALSAASVLLTSGLGGPIVQAVLGTLLMFALPAWLISAKIRWHPSLGAERILYSVGITVVGLLVGGLAVNTVLPLLGVSRPLATASLTCVLWVVNLGLLLWRRDVELHPVRKGFIEGLCAPLHRRQLPMVAAVAAVVLACTGAIRLNNGAGEAVALLGFVVVICGVAGQLMRRTATPGSDSAVLFLSAAALLLGTSLRGWYIIGHDIQREYFVYLLTQQAEHWQFQAFADPYNACLSVSLLPAMAASVTGLSGLVLFKVAVQLLFACLPVLTYLYSRRLLSRRLALVSAGFVMAFPTFFVDMPFIVRQEVAFFFLGLVILAATQPGWTARRRTGLVTAFGSGMVLSHYSTTYILVTTLGLGLAVRAVSALLARRQLRPGPEAVVPEQRRRGQRVQAVLLSGPVILSLLAMSWLWTGPATNSGGHLGDVVVASVKTLVHGDQSSESADLRYSLFSGAPEPPQQKLDRFADQVYVDASAERAGGELLPVTPAQRRPRILDDSVTDPTALGRWFEGVGGDPETVHELSRNLVALLLQVFMLVGAGAVLSRRGPTQRFTFELRLLTFATLSALGAQVLLPGISAEYGVLRSFLQSLLILAPVLTLGCVLLLRPLGRRVLTAAVATLVAIWTVTVGLTSQVLGGYPAQLDVADTGPYHDLYYTTEEEVRGIRWLDEVLQSENVQSDVVTDRYSVRRMAVFRGTYSGTNDDFFPSQLRRDSYVFVGAATLKRHAATVFYGGDLLTYSYPMAVLDTHKNLVFNSGNARVYR